ncbi:putative secreted protein [Streptomyces avermitilis MA-4680 = NBRC 14893]|uniref:Secreted protein n=1 Tax=Streptomyces avermitilis (strain ATCC 31267 / DSM 46492 / JCM 5070 / NBRC 14893 / NCIMB 12804 / NRRL 8165 / MA-4680) TaxID=227882 RepID=Q82G30_STRAW|nr:putative secreted protein [Streptomyces avermitilis MA-4680 = NBRC 14893]
MRGLSWTVLRLHRSAVVLWGGALLAATVALIWMYAIGDDARAGIGACATPATGQLPPCSAVHAITADGIYADTLASVGTAVSYLMFPVAAWAGGALTGRELETGTAHLDWTQSVTPARWLAARLTVPAALLASGTAAAVLLNVWARQDGNPDLVGDWYYADVFVSTGPAAVAHVLAGLALGALAGLLTKKTLPAIGLALAATLVLHNALDWYRTSLWPTVTTTGRAALDLPRSALDLEHGVITTTGERIGNNTACVGSDSLADVQRCKSSSNLTDFWATYHPRSHFWPLQFMETGLLLALAAAATATAFWLLRRRTA